MNYFIQMPKVEDIPLEDRVNRRLRPVNIFISYTGAVIINEVIFEDPRIAMTTAVALADSGRHVGVSVKGERLAVGHVDDKDHDAIKYALGRMNGKRYDLQCYYTILTRRLKGDI